MKRVWNWIKKWSFLILILLTGIVYLSVENEWQVYAKPLEKLQDMWKSAGNSGLGDDTDNADNAGGQSVSGNDDSTVSGGDTGERTETELSPTQEAEGQQTVSGSDVSENVTYRGPEEVSYVTVEDDYFSDAVFIGDSRTVGLYEYAGLEQVSTFYASTGLTVYKMFDAPIVEVPGQKAKETVEQALSEKQFSKIYLMIGINEMGTGTVDSFLEAYAEAVQHIRELQPDAVLYLQAIMKVTTERSGKGDYITNEGIEARNEGIKKMADNVKVYYLDVNPLICDETGGMEPSYTFDGVHLKAQYVSIWKDFLKSHAVEQLPLD